MACDRLSSQVGSTAAGKTGLTALQSQAGQVSGRLLARLERGLGQSASATLRVVGSVDLPRSVEALLPVAAVGALIGGGQTRLRVLNTVGALQVARTATTGLGTAAARLSRSGPVKHRNYFDRVQLRSWPSRLTPLLNAGDIRGGLHLTVKASRGQIFESRGQSWHLGVTTVQTSQGERTIGHLQRLSLPAGHYYFNRAPTEVEVAGLVSGQREFEPKHLPGYVGEVTEVEGLTPLWAGLKRQLIQSRLFWGD